MKNIKLNMLLVVAGILVTTIGATIAFMRELWAPGILISLSVALLIGVLLSLVKNLVRTMSDFVKALEVNDSTLRVDADSHDKDIREMAECMNRIASIHAASSKDLETRKLYYDRILRVMTHEMRNSITPVVALSSDIISNPGNYDSENIREAIGVIKSESDNIKKFLDSYHTLTHLPRPEIKTVDAITFFKNIQKATDVFADEINIPKESVEYLIPADAKLQIDEAMMTRSLVNLIKNAMEAVGGRDNEPEIRIRLTQNLENSIITISDNGPGLSDRMVGNLFQPFVTTKTGGSGIGMFLSRQIIRLHGGDISVINQPGKGLCLTLRFKFFQAFMPS